MITPVKISGSLGRFRTTNRRCGCKDTKITQNAAKYNMYGVNIASAIEIANKNEYIGLGRFSPWIFEPSQRSSVGQNTSIIRGVPLPAKNKNGVDSTTRQDARSDTLFLNQRLRRSISKIPSTSPIIMLGSLIV